jgi:hypothetical protein
MKMMLAPALVLVLATSSCRMSTVQDEAIGSRPYLLSAYATGSDAVGATFCQVAAILPAHLSVRDQWSDTVSVYVTRERPTGGSRVDTTATQMVVEVTTGPADSISVSIHGAFHLDLPSTATNSAEAAGTWTCDDSVPLSRTLSGASQGVWVLLPDRYHQLD